jgi:hypothetical protein
MIGLLCAAGAIGGAALLGAMTACDCSAEGDQQFVETVLRGTDNPDEPERLYSSVHVPTFRCTCTGGIRQVGGPNGRDIATTTPLNTGLNSRQAS